MKIRGSALHVAEKYAQLSRDAQSAGDRVMAENYLQHAEHYYRIVAAAQQPSQQQHYRDDQQREGRDDDPRHNGERGDYQPSMRDRQFDDDEDDEQLRLNGEFGHGAANGARHLDADRPDRPDRPDRRATGNGAGIPDEQPVIDDAAMAEAGLVPIPTDDDGRTRRRRGLRASRVPRPRTRPAAGDGGETGTPGDTPDSDSTPKDA